MTIGETVREAQETLAGMGRCMNWDWVHMMEDEIFGRPSQYPKSLGELCIEVAQERIRRANDTTNNFLNVIARGGHLVQFDLHGIHRELQNLRYALYHRARGEK